MSATTVERPVELPERWLQPSVSGAGAPDRAVLMAELEELGLMRYAAQLDIDGFTVVPPELASTPEFITRLRGAVVTVIREDHDLDIDADGELDAPSDPRGIAVTHAVLRGPAFEEAVLNRASLALLSYLLGTSYKLSLSAAVAKTPGDLALPLHADNPPWQPDPWPPYAQVANATWLLTDYAKEGGALCFVAGSHRLQRRTTDAEAANFDNENLITVEAPAGSLAVWHGCTWHGAHPRRAAGARLSYTTLGCRPYMQVQQGYRDLVSDEALERNPERFKMLMGFGDPAPYGPEGPSPRTSYDGIQHAGRSLYT